MKLTLLDKIYSLLNLVDMRNWQKEFKSNSKVSNYFFYTVAVFMSLNFFWTRCSCFPLDTRRILNVRRTFRRCRGRLLNVLHTTYALYPGGSAPTQSASFEKSTGYCTIDAVYRRRLLKLILIFSPPGKVIEIFPSEKNS